LIQLLANLLDVPLAAHHVDVSLCKERLKPGRSLLQQGSGAAYGQELLGF
jgi:hypothetical protein